MMKHCIEFNHIKSSSAGTVGCQQSKRCLRHYRSGGE